MVSQRGEVGFADGLAGDAVAQRSAFGRAADAFQPAEIQRFFDGGKMVAGDGRLIFLSSGVAVADKESGEEQRHAHGSGSGVVAEQARLIGSETRADGGEMLQRPQFGIRRRRIGIVKDGVRSRDRFHRFAEIPGVKKPDQFQRQRALPAAIRNQPFHGLGVWREVAEFLGVIEGEAQWVGSVIEAMQFDPAAGNFSGFKRLQHRDRIRRRPETDVPNHKPLPRRCCPLDEPLLMHMQRDGFDHRPHDRMKCFAKFPRAETSCTGLNGHEIEACLVFAGMHRRKLGAGKCIRNRAACVYVRRRPLKNIGHQQLSIPAYAPVMVLPGALLFPHTLMPLYIFEPRYRAMLTWSLEQHRMFCIAPMKPGLTEATSEEDFHHTVGIGLVRACVGREDGTSHLVLPGLSRVRITGFVQEWPFRVAEIREVTSEPAGSLESPALTLKLLELCAHLKARGATMPEKLDEQLTQIDDPSVLTDVLAHTFLSDPEKRQAVFEEPKVGLRAHLLIHYLLDSTEGPGLGE